MAKPDAVALHRLAYAQDGHFTARQAGERGFSPQLLAHHVRAGRYERVRRGIYRLGSFPAAPREEVRVGWLSVGAGRAIVSHESALELHGLSDVVPDAVHLTVERGHRGVRPPPGVVLHTSTVPPGPGEVVVRDGMRVTAPARSILDAASAGAAPEQIELAVRQLVAQGLVAPGDLVAQAERRSRRVARLVRPAADEP